MNYKSACLGKNYLISQMGTAGEGVGSAQAKGRTWVMESERNAGKGKL